jgi:hypothetical protein
MQAIDFFPLEVIFAQPGENHLQRGGKYHAAAGENCLLRKS